MIITIRENDTLIKYRWIKTYLVIAYILCFWIGGIMGTGMADDKVHIKVYYLPPPEDVSVGGMADRLVLEAFHRKYPYIEVSSFFGIRVEGVVDIGTLMAVAGGVSPDIISVNFNRSDSYIQQGFLYPLDEYITDIHEEELNERIPPPVWPVIFKDGPDGKRHLWALPFVNYVKVMYYRKDLFQGAGLNPEHPPGTWDELYEYCQRLTKQEKGIYGISTYAGGSESYFWYTYLLSAGGKALAKDKEGNWQAVFNSDGASKAALFYAKLVQKEYNMGGKKIKGVSYRGVDEGTKWDQGKVGIREGYLTDLVLSNVNPDQIGVAPVSKGPGGIRGAEINCGMMGMFAGIKERKKRDAAWKFIYFWNSPEAIEIRTRVYVENGYVRFLNPMHLEKYGYHDYIRRVPKGWGDVYLKAVKYGEPEPYGKNSHVIYEMMTKPLERILREDMGNAEPGYAQKKIKEILDAAVTETNEKMLQKISPEKMSYRRKVAFGAGLFIGLTFILMFVLLIKALTPEHVSIVQKKVWGFAKYRYAYFILLPAVGAVLLWQYVPLLRGAVIAFLDYRIMGGSKWIGLDNFAMVLFDQFFWVSLWHGFYFAFLSILLGFFTPIILAILLHEVPRGKILFRLIYYLPAVISGIIVMFMWKGFYDPSSAGLLNRILNVFGIPPQGWLSNSRQAMVCIVLPIVWAGIGPGSLIYLAALKTIPEELYESAEIDGAGFLNKVFLITIPVLKPLILINFIGAFVGAVKAADFIMVMTGGGPAGATHVIGLEIFYNAFFYLKFGIATAMAWILGFILIGFTAYQIKRISRMQFKTAQF